MLSRGELLAKIQRYAKGFQVNGLQPGDRVCIHIGDTVENYASMMGCVFAGASIVLAKTSLTARELRYQVSDSDCTHVLIDPELVEKTISALATLTLKGKFATGPAKGFISTSGFVNIEEASFREVLIEDPRDCVLAICYTSGTTGRPKGVVASHYGFVANMATAGPCFPWDESDVTLVAAPITHGSGLVCITFGVLLGATVVMMSPKADAHRVAQLVSKYKVVDEQTQRRLGANETGEICFRTPSMMKEYYKKPKETAEIFDEDGWCKSGDAGFYDGDGRLHIVQRLKEMIKCMDNQMAPAELEDLLLTKHSEEISEVAVVGLPQPYYGEAPAALAVPQGHDSGRDYGSLADLAERMKATIAANFAVHKHLYGGVFFFDSFPKTETMKVNRPKLIEECASKRAF
ncbi:uncharacterized protein LOC144175596 [Haemaphysalis longicornis]